MILLRQSNDVSKRIKSRRRISALMAAVLLVTGTCTAIHFNRSEVQAKETLESIKQVVSDINSQNPFKILEVVPDSVSFNVVLNDCYGNDVSVSGDQIMGFMGYYVKGEEPIRTDMSNMLNDSETEDGYIYSTLSDSNLRYNMYAAFAAPLVEDESSIAYRGNGGIDSKPLFINGVSEYDEIREGECITTSGRSLSEEAFMEYVHTMGYTRLTRDYGGFKGDKVRYVDTALGTITKEDEPGEGNYLKYYDSDLEGDEDIAGAFIKGYLSVSANSGSDANDKNTVTPILDGQGAIDDNFCYVSYNGLFDNESGIFVASGEERNNGFFDPNLKYAEENSGDVTVINGENEDKKADIYANFRYDAGLTTGYYVIDTKEVKDPTAEEIEKGYDIPLYKWDSLNEVFIYAGDMGAIFGNMSTSVNEVINPDNFAAPVILSAKLETLTEDNEIGYDEEFIDDEEPLKEEENETIDAKDSLSEVDELNDYDNGYEFNSADQIGSTIMSDEDPTGDVGGTYDDAYYVLKFRYTDSPSIDDKLYCVSCFRYSEAERGAQYILDTDSEYGTIIPNVTGRGTIIVRNDAPESVNDAFIYEYKFGKGNYSFTGSEPVSDDVAKAYDIRPYRIRGAEVYYKIDITNNEWFKRNILDRDERTQCDKLTGKIKVLTKKASELTGEDTVGAKLIMVMSGDTAFCIGDTFEGYSFAENDITYKGMINLLTQVVDNDIPVIGDYRIVKDHEKLSEIDNTVKEPAISNLIRAFELSETNLERYFNTVQHNGESVFKEIVQPAGNSGELTHKNNDHYVRERIYIYNRGVTQDSDAGYMCFLNDSMMSSYGNESTIGFSEVITDIETENLFRRAEKLKDLDTKVSQATVVRYIIGFNKKRNEQQVKGTMRILELEPCASFDLTTNANTVDDNGNIIGSKLYVSGRQEPIIDQEGTKIIVTRMTTSEFIGRIEDINVQYDMIYIGMNIGMMNVRKPERNDWDWRRDDVRLGRALNYDDDITDYNDDTMDGLIYSNVGDINTSTTDEGMAVEAAGMLADEYYWNDKKTGNLKNSKFKTRYSGNDITQEKRDALINFVNAGYPVMLSNRFFKPDNSINTCALDTASYMYDFVYNVKVKKNEDNVFKLDNLSTQLFKYYINLSKPRIVLDDPALSSTVSPVYLVKDSSTGKYKLPIYFSIENDGAVSVSDTYEVNLLVDLNADGKYSPTQEEVEFSTMVEYDADGNSSTITKTRIYPEEGDSDEYGYRTDDAGRKYYDTYVVRRGEGYRYYAEYYLSEKHIGVIPWRLIVKQSGNHRRRANATGYFQAPVEEKPKIRVLQINSVPTYKVNGEKYGDPTWNMQEWYEKGSRNETDNDPGLEPDIKEYRRNLYRKFYEYVSGTGEASTKGMMPYDIEITTIPSTEFSLKSPTFVGLCRSTLNVVDVTNDTLSAENRAKMEIKIDRDLRPGKDDPDSDWSKIKAEYLKYISDNRYDMLIMGFADMYIAPDSIAVDAIKDYIKSGKSVLFTHDTTSIINTQVDQAGKSGDTQVVPGNHVVWGYEYNTLLRNLVGMDRYNVLGEGDTSDKNRFKKDSVYTPRSERRSSNELTSREVHGFTYFAINRNTDHPNLRYLKGLPDHRQNGAFENMTVRKVNDGQITQYPYKLKDNFKVARTHGQYYQLDFATDDDFDGESDIVVWYCLDKADGDSYYTKSPGDVRNNYYIYNKGNITYSGVGHMSMSTDNVKNATSVDEIMLFVNTMVAAYKAGIQPPAVSFMDSTGTRATGNVYITYDEQLEEMRAATQGGMLGTTKDVYFKPEQVSLVQNAEHIHHTMYAKLYYKVPSGGTRQIVYDDPRNPVTLSNPDANKHSVREVPIESLWYTDDATRDDHWVECTDIDAALGDLKSGYIYKARIKLGEMGQFMGSGTSVYDYSLLFVEASDHVHNDVTGYDSTMTDISAADFVRTEVFLLD